VARRAAGACSPFIFDTWAIRSISQGLAGGAKDGNVWGMNKWGIVFIQRRPIVYW